MHTRTHTRPHARARTHTTLGHQEKTSCLNASEHRRLHPKSTQQLPSSRRYSAKTQDRMKWGGTIKWFYFSHTRGLQYIPRDTKRGPFFFGTCCTRTLPSASTRFLKGRRLEGQEERNQIFSFLSKPVELIRVSTFMLWESFSIRVNKEAYFYLFSQLPLIILWTLQAGLQWHRAANSSSNVNYTWKHNTSLFLSNMYKF